MQLPYFLSIKWNWFHYNSCGDKKVYVVHDRKLAKPFHSDSPDWGNYVKSDYLVGQSNKKSRAKAFELPM